MAWLRAERMVTGSGTLTPGWLRVDDGTIAAVRPEPPAAPVTDLGDVVMMPGFVDVHCHGGGGASFGGAAAEIARAAAFHLEHGTTTVVGSLVTEAPDVLLRQVRALATATRGGSVAGVHLEGPWLAPGRCGAHEPSLLRRPDLDEARSLLAAAAGTLRMVTLAPELPGAPALITVLRDAGVRVAVGHTDADHDTVVRALEAGASVATHLFNAMPAFHHRRPGPVPALLGDPATIVELVCDGVHVHPAVVSMAVRAAGPERVALVTDAVAAAGTGDGEMVLGPRRIVVRDGIARLADGGALAGSTLTMAAAVRIAVTEVGVNLDEAATMASSTPARLLGLADRGALAPGRRADLVVLDPDLRVTRVMSGGRWVS